MAQENDGHFGGRITFQFGSLTIPPSEAEITIDPALFEKTSKTNSDGTVAYELKPKQPGADIKFRNKAGIDWQAIMLQSGNVTIVEDTNGRTHLFTGTELTGTPKVNTSTGEVDGLRVEGGVYQKLNRS